MRNSLLMFLLCAAAAAVCACSDENDEQVMPSITPSAVSMQAAGGTRRLSLDLKGGDAASLTVVSDQTWCRAAIEQGAISLTVDPNTSKEGRNAILSLMSGTQTLSQFSVVQSKAGLAVETTLLEIDASDRQHTISVVGDLEWKAEKSGEWFTIATSETTLTVTPEQNSGESVRRGQITITCGSITKTIGIKQTGNKLIIHGRVVDFNCLAETYPVRIDTYNDWAASSEQEWIELDQKEGELIIGVRANTLPDARTGEVTVVSGTQRQTITVNQFNLFSSLSGAWKLTALTQREGQKEYPHQVTIEADRDGETLLVNGFGQDYLQAGTYAPISMLFDAQAKSCTATTDEYLGTFNFYGFPSANGDADVYSILVTYDNGAFNIYPGEKHELSATWNDDLTQITFAADRGIYYGMWDPDKEEFSGSGCSQRMVNIVLTRETASLGGSASATAAASPAAAGTNRFIE